MSPVDERRRQTQTMDIEACMLHVWKHAEASLSTPLEGMTRLAPVEMTAQQRMVHKLGHLAQPPRSSHSSRMSSHARRGCWNLHPGAIPGRQRTSRTASSGRSNRGTISCHRRSGSSPFCQAVRRHRGSRWQRRRRAQRRRSSSCSGALAGRRWTALVMRSDLATGPLARSIRSRCVTAWRCQKLRFSDPFG